MTTRIYRGNLKSSVIQFGSPERVDWHLDNWSRWQKSGKRQGAYGAVAVGLSSGGASQDFDMMADSSEIRSARIVDVIIHDLPAHQVCALHNEYLAMVWRFERLRQADVLAEAKAGVGRGLVAKGVY